MWRGEGAWIALSMTSLFLVVAGVMHSAFVRILKSGAAEPVQKENHE